MQVWGQVDTIYNEKDGVWSEFFVAKTKEGKRTTDAMTGRGQNDEVFKGLWGGGFEKRKGIQVRGESRVGKVGLLVQFIPWLLLKEGRWEAFERWLKIEGHTVLNGLERGGAKGRKAVQGSDNYERAEIIDTRAKVLKVGSGWLKRTCFFDIGQLHSHFGLNPLPEGINTRLVVTLALQGGGRGPGGNIGERSAEEYKVEDWCYRLSRSNRGLRGDSLGIYSEGGAEGGEGGAQGGFGESDESEEDDSDCESECSLDVDPPKEESRKTHLDLQMEEVKHGLDKLAKGEAKLKERMLELESMWQESEKELKRSMAALEISKQEVKRREEKAKRETGEMIAEKRAMLEWVLKLGGSKADFEERFGEVFDEEGGLAGAANRGRRARKENKRWSM
ncbi:hypothetical protein TrRE_jg6596 [Triparma retinervis]|uniref:Uncharacterized protein n=1 Tax=Triparma retinervis TaxID=2557542 RepID=A0A9W7A7F1_9STRA|nr:hypothetical protein TrRE_jg6596 [Triparma retinervis]